MIKEKAKWIPKYSILIKQLIISIKSFLTLCFYKPENDGIQKYFRKNYYEKPDLFIFDGSTNGYYTKINSIIDVILFRDRTIIDLGCGRGVLYHWLNVAGVSRFKYIGIDFAINDIRMNDNSILIKDDLSNIEKYISSGNNIIFMSNTLCYIDNNKFILLLRKLKKNEEIIIIEPSPNLFWDAHFNGVKPIYRKISEVKYILENENYTIYNTVQDYYLKLGNRFLLPISYCIHAKR